MKKKIGPFQDHNLLQKENIPEKAKGLETILNIIMLNFMCFTTTVMDGYDERLHVYSIKTNTKCTLDCPTSSSVTLLGM